MTDLPMIIDDPGCTGGAAELFGFLACLTEGRASSGMHRRAIHFVGFRGDEYHRARRVFGDPDFVHINWDRRARREIADGDTVLFARGDASQAPRQYNSPDLIGIDALDAP